MVCRTCTSRVRVATSARANTTTGRRRTGSYWPQRLANGMSAAWTATQRTPLSAADVQWRTRSVVLPAAPHLNEQALLKTLDDASLSAAARGGAASDLAWLRRCLHQDPIQVSCLQLGPAKILHLPGEVVVEYQLAAQQEHPDDFVAVAAYGDYGPGYICLQEHYQQGGYESSPGASRVAPQTESILQAAIRAVLRVTVSNGSRWQSRPSRPLRTTSPLAD